MEAFDLAVGLRPPGPGPAGADAQVAAGVPPGVLAVGPGIVGQDPFDADAQGREVGRGPGQEGRAGRGGLVGQVLGVGDAAVVVEGGVQVGPAGAVGPAAVAAGPAESLVAAAVGDPAQLLDVDVDQFAGAGAFVAADGFAGGPVQGRQGRLVMADEDAVGGRDRDVAPDGEPQGTDAVFTAELTNLLRIPHGQERLTPPTKAPRSHHRPRGVVGIGGFMPSWPAQLGSPRSSRRKPAPRCAASLVANCAAGRRPSGGPSTRGASPYRLPPGVRPGRT